MITGKGKIWKLWIWIVENFLEFDRVADEEYESSSNLEKVSDSLDFTGELDEKEEEEEEDDELEIIKLNFWGSCRWRRLGRWVATRF